MRYLVFAILFASACNSVTVVPIDDGEDGGDASTSDASDAGDEG
jgi:hypothetical protein